jgi:hypothetical protein
MCVEEILQYIPIIAILFIVVIYYNNLLEIIAIIGKIFT